MVKTLAVLTTLLGGAHNHLLPMKLTSSVVQQKGELPAAYTCYGHSLVLPLQWRHAPKPGTRSLAAIMVDEDAPTSQRYLWSVYNISLNQHRLTLGGKLLHGERYAKNSWNHLSYHTPCPSAGDHHYVIRLYALNVRFYFRKAVSAPTLIEAMKHNVLATTTLNMHFNPKPYGYHEPQL